MPGARRTAAVPSSSSQLKDEIDMSPTHSAESPEGSDDIPMDRKKATHLRCERQRREAINNGYSELKDLLPPQMMTLGCKTTNAAILFRACDYMKQLNDEDEQAEKDLTQLNAELSALRMIAQQYETMAADKPLEHTASAQARMLQVLLDDCFKSFTEQVDTSTYPNVCRTLLQWIETLENDTPTTVAKMAAVPFKKARR